MQLSKQHHATTLFINDDVRWEYGGDDFLDTSTVLWESSSSAVKMCYICYPFSKYVVCNGGDDDDDDWKQQWCCFLESIFLPAGEELHCLLCSTVLWMDVRFSFVVHVVVVCVWGWVVTVIVQQCSRSICVVKLAWWKDISWLRRSSSITWRRIYGCDMMIWCMVRRTDETQTYRPDRMVRIHVPGKEVVWMACVA